MGKKKSNEKKISREEENFQKGRQIHQNSPLFSRLYGGIYTAGNRIGQKDWAAMVDKDGHIYINTKYDLEPKQWVYAIAHCQLHLAFGHFDADKIPGYETVGEDGTRKTVVHCNPYLWNMACDIYVSRFLENVKFGKTIHGAVTDDFPRNLKEEIQIYEYLKENHYEDKEQTYGTAGIHGLDMTGLDTPVTYKEKETNRFAEKFAWALAESVSKTVGKAGGYHSTLENVSEKTTKAAQWFISHYPLLGGIATGFKIIEDYDFCIREEIQIAR